MSCMNENCDRDPLDSPNKIVWGCDGDFVCNKYCYGEAKKQMDNFCSVMLTDDKKFMGWLGVSDLYEE